MTVFHFRAAMTSRLPEPLLNAQVHTGCSSTSATGATHSPLIFLNISFGVIAKIKILETRGRPA